MSAAASPNPKGSKLTSEENRVQLTVKAGDGSAEIFLIGNDLSLLDRGIGTLVTTQPAGIYKVRVRTSFAVQEQFVILRAEPVTEIVGSLSFASPVPLDNTAKSHEYHQEAARNESKRVHLKVGQGSSIFLFMREWTPPGSFSSPLSPRLKASNAASGVKLRTMDGTVVADMVTCAALSPSGIPNYDPWAACNIVLNPGAYRLGVQTVEGEFEQTIIAPLNWHVHIFTLLRTYTENDQQERKADLVSSAVMLSRSQEFLPDSDDARLVELAKLGLTQKRKVLSSELRNEILAGKFSDPMLGILGGHLLLMEQPVDSNLLGLVVDNLRGMLGSGHPDVEALALRVSPTPSPFAFAVPPMLHRSWTQILDCTADQRATVMRNSFAGRIIRSTCAGEPWLVWRNPDSAPETMDDEMVQVLRSYLRGRSVANSARANRSSRLKRKLTGAGQRAYSASLPVTEEIAARPVGLQTSRVQPPPVGIQLSSINADKMRDLIHNMGVPRFAIEDLLKKVNVNPTEKSSA